MVVFGAQFCFMFCLYCFTQTVVAVPHEDTTSAFSRHASHHHHHTGTKRKQPRNILLILADDLGYGDTSVKPFVGSGILTPELEKMASRGAIMTNFHTAAATCTPTRASILTGMYPWRMGIKAVFEYGEKGKSNRDDWLPQLPTVAAAFRDANYSTLHSGKWHVGGMRNDDLDLRLLPMVDGRLTDGVRRCPHPGPNQQGFEHYVSVLDGPGAPRQGFLQVEEKLYSHGCNHLLHNDEYVTARTFSPAISGSLSHCEASHAMRMMNESVAHHQPFYMHVWFHAPHGPWAEIPGYRSMYGDQLGAVSSRASRYKTMVTDMDRNIGRLLQNLRALGVERDTLVVFLSDNGPEDGAGRAADFRGNKRHIYEGGIRVPAVFQWVGTIPAGRVIDSFAMSTDLYPTFLDAAGVRAPSTARLDGISLLPELVGKHGPRLAKHRRLSAERVALWHNDYEGPRRTALWTRDFKLFLDEREAPCEMYDMRADPRESRNLLRNLTQAQLGAFVSAALSSDFTAQHTVLDKQPLQLSEHALQHDRANPRVHLAVLSHAFRALYEFARHGDEAHRLYAGRNQGRAYPMTIASDQRTVHQGRFRKVSQQQDQANRLHMLLNGSCGGDAGPAALCSCDPKAAEEVPSLPFEEVPPSRHYLTPTRFLNGSKLLGFAES